MNVKGWKREIVYLLLLFILAGCFPEEPAGLKKTWLRAKQNRKELEQVIRHYEILGDTLKRKAALFLIGNMADHYSIQSEAVDEYVRRLRGSDTLVMVPQMNAWWKELREKNTPVRVYDASVLSADFLIHEIDCAFEIWQRSKWKDQVDFEGFCNYLLPYRCHDELLNEGWRDTLYREYYPVVADVADMLEAFGLICDTVNKQLLSGSNAFPYVAGVLDMKHQYKASCVQRSIYIVSVMRAVGLPAALDYVSRWANYSRNGHAWPALVTAKGTYTYLDGDSVARQNHRIGSSWFDIGNVVPPDYPYPTDYKKRVAKVFRRTYENYPSEISEVRENHELFGLIPEGSGLDVSDCYGFNRDIRIEVGSSDKAYLCVFATGKGWRPMGYAWHANGRYMFEHYGDSVVYLPVEYKEGDLFPLGFPFIPVGRNEIRELVPDLNRRERVVLTRKYPLTGTFINRWSGMIGGYFEGSNDPEFRDKKILHVINDIPIFRNKVILNDLRTFRYIRYQAVPECGYPMAEIEIWSGGRLLHGTPFAVGVEKKERGFDGDTFTAPVTSHKGFVLGIDLGESVICDSLVYHPGNDGNFVVPGHEYELFYYDRRWISLGRQKADGWQVIYDHVPQGALLILKDHTAGQEERIFTYEGGSQVWW